MIMQTRHCSVLLAAILGGCTTFSPDAGFDGVRDAARERGVRQEARWLRSEQDAAGCQAGSVRSHGASLPRGADPPTAGVRWAWGR